MSYVVLFLLGVGLAALFGASLVAVVAVLAVAVAVAVTVRVFLPRRR